MKKHCNSLPEEGVKGRKKRLLKKNQLGEQADSFSLGAKCPKSLITESVTASTRRAPSALVVTVNLDTARFHLCPV